MTLKKPKLLVLYAEVMPYNVVCFKDFVQTTHGEIKVVCWDNNKKLTPYSPPFINNVSYYLNNNFNQNSIKKLIDDYKPTLLYVAGRMEPNYLAASAYARKKNIPVVGVSDNQFIGNWKQQLTKMFSWLLWRRYFNYMMVPGIYQYEYLRYLNFSRDQILFCSLCPDTQLFQEYYQLRNQLRQDKNYILFVGRLDKVKGLDILLEAFKELNQDKTFNLKLMIIGGGPLSNETESTDDVKLKGFLDQKEIIKLLPMIKFFCLPSRREPWGVAIHEFAAAGLPIITTSTCGASTAFVKNDYNGYIIPPNNKDALKKAIKKMNNLNKETLDLYGERSYDLARQITPQMWTATINSVLNTK